jgi:GntR family transcriptional regulator
VGVKAKRSFVPAYYQIADDLSREIEGGRLRPGDLIPSESQLCERYTISRMTVRQGLNLLSDAGYIHSVPGKGSYVAMPHLDRMTLEFQEGILGDGRRLEPLLVGADLVPAEAEVAARLDVAEGSAVIEFSRVSTLEGAPISFERKFLPHAGRNPLNEKEIRYVAFPSIVAHASDVQLVRVQMDLYAAPAPETACRFLDLAPDQACCALVMEQTVLAQDDRVLGWGRTYCTERYRLSAESNPFWRRF